MTYSCMRMHTTIGAAAFHFRVRNGIGWCHSAIVTRERVEGRGPIVLVKKTRDWSRTRSHRVGRSEWFLLETFVDECHRRVVEGKAT